MACIGPVVPSPWTAAACGGFMACIGRVVPSPWTAAGRPARWRRCRGSPSRRPPMPADLGALLSDLAAETASLRTLIDPLPDARWTGPTSAPGWSIADTVGHLAYFDDAAVRAATDPRAFRAGREDPVDPEAIAARHRPGRAGTVRAWFGRARALLREVFAGLDPATLIPWYGPEM